MKRFLLALLLAAGCKEAPAQSPEKTASPVAAPAPAPAPTPAPAPPPAAASTQRIPPFTAKTIDLRGDAPKDGQFDSHKLERSTALLFVGTTCPATRDYIERVRLLEKTYGRKVDFVFVYPQRSDSPEAKRQFHRGKGFAGPMIDDQGGRIAKLAGAKRTSEVHFLARDGTVLYRGGVDDSRDPAAVKRRHVATAIEEHFEGKPVTVAAAPVFA